MSDFYMKEAEKSKWIREGIDRERNRILKLIEEKKFKNENWCNDDLIIVKDFIDKLSGDLK